MNDVPQVLFVCVHNAGRSQMAAGLLAKYAGRRIVVRSAGSAPADEVNPVIRELHAYGIQVTALHSHMLRENPRLFFTHFWGVDTPEKIAEGIKAALAKVAPSKEK